MTTPSEVLPVDTVGAIARCRYMVLKRADEILNEQPGIPVTEQPDAIPNLSALLMISLEELKVAEEQLRVQNATLETQRVAINHKVRHYRQLFLYSPAPAFVTDVYGTIQEANIAAATLFRREAPYMEGKPLVTLLAPEHREEFRRQLPRMNDGEGVRDWRLVIKRMGDVPLETRAMVQLVPGIGQTGSGVLYWMLTVLGKPE
jgi:PAS domain S-box-containing protein